MAEILAYPEQNSLARACGNSYIDDKPQMMMMMMMLMIIIMIIMITFWKNI